MSCISFFIALVIYSGWYYTDRNNEIKIVSNNSVEKKTENITESNNGSYVIIEENFDVKSPITLNMKNKDGEIKNSMLEENVNIAEVEKKPPIKPIKSNLTNENIVNCVNRDL